MANLPTFTLTELLEAGVHFGHKTQRWNPAMAPYIYTARNGIHIIDLRTTVPMLATALTALRNVVAGGGRVLFVGTKPQAQDVLKEEAERCGQYYMTHRWLGGTLTNWKTISKSITRLKNLEEDFAAGEEIQEKLANVQEGETVALNHRQKAFLARTKKEKLMMTRERAKLTQSLGGIKDMGGLPDAVIVMDIKQEHIAVAEANHLGIPVIALVDTNTNPTDITYPIPANDDSRRSIALFARLFADTILAGLEAQVSKPGRSSAKSTTSTTPEQQANVTVNLSDAAKKAAEKAEAEAKAKAEEKAAEAKAAETATAAKATEAKAESKSAAKSA